MRPPGVQNSVESARAQRSFLVPAGLFLACVFLSFPVRNYSKTRRIVARVLGSLALIISLSGRGAFDGAPQLLENLLTLLGLSGITAWAASIYVADRR
jgi:hypothetical protein